MPRPLLFALLLAIAAPSSAEMYRWTDENGQVHFSDRQSQDSTEVSVKEGNNFRGREAQERVLRAGKADSNWSKPHYQPKRATPTHDPHEEVVAERKLEEQRRRDYMETCKKQRRVNCGEEAFQKEESARKFMEDPRAQQNLKDAIQARNIRRQNQPGCVPASHCLSP